MSRTPTHVKHETHFQTHFQSKFFKCRRQIYILFSSSMRSIGLDYLNNLVHVLSLLLKYYSYIFYMILDLLILGSYFRLNTSCHRCGFFFFYSPSLRIVGPFLQVLQFIPFTILLLVLFYVEYCMCVTVHD